MSRTYYYYTNILYKHLSNYNQVAISQDTKEHRGNKKYFIENIDDLDISKNENLYELITIEKPVKLYFDLEFNTDILKVLPLFHDEINNFFKKTFNEELSEPIRLESDIKQPHNEKSYHFIYNTRKFFKNNQFLKCFIIEFIHYINENKIEDLKYINYKGNEKFIFDTSVYSRNQSFRMLNQSKKGSVRTLRYSRKNIKYEIKDVLVCDYTNTTDFYDYDIDKYVNNLNNNNKQKKSKIFGSNIKKLDPFKISIYYELKNIPFTKDRKPVIIKNKNDILLNIPNKNKYRQSKNVWMFIGSLCKKMGINLKIFNKWTNDNTTKSYNRFEDLNEENYDKTKSEIMLINILSKYRVINDVRNIKEFYELDKKLIKNKYKSYSQKYLKDLIVYKEDKIKINRTKKINEHFDEIINKKIKPIIKPIKIDDDGYKPYCNETDFIHFKTLLIKSGLGTGKTTQLKKNIEKYNSCIILTPRITFAINILNELNGNIIRKDGSMVYFQLYQDIKDKHSFYTCNYLVIQHESLHKLYDAENNITNTFELVCIDEVESIQTQMTSKKTNKQNMDDNFKCFRHLVQNSKRNLFCDGFLSNRTLIMCKELHLDYEIIHNTYINEGKTATQLKFDKNTITIDDITNFLHTEIIEKNNKMYCVIAKKKLLREIKLEPFIKAGKKVKIYHGDLKDDEKVIKDVNKEWVKYDLIMTTTTITVGIDFKQNHFNKHFIFGDYQCGLIRDVFQSLFRDRTIKNLYYCFNSVVNEQRKIELNTIENNIDKKVRMINNFCYMKSKDSRDEVEISTFMKKKMDEWSKNILAFNLYEKEINRRLYPFVFEYFLKITGFKIENEINYYQNAKIEIAKKDIPKGTYHSTKNITRMECEKIKKKNNNDRSIEEQLQLHKYNFNILFDEIPDDIDTAFELYIDPEKKNTRQIFYNLYAEKYLTSNELFERQQDYYKEVMSLNPIKLRIINEIKSLYNIKNIMDTDFIIKTTELNNKYKELPKFIKEAINTTYDTKKYKTNYRKIKKVFEDWCDNTLINKEKMNNGIRANYYMIKPKPIYKNIYELLKDRKEKCEIIKV